MTRQVNKVAPTDTPAVASTGSAATPARRDLFERELFEKASQLFASKGFSGTTLQDIANALGVSRPSLYHYIRSKDELLERVVCDMAEISDKRIGALLADSAHGPVDKLRAIVVAMTEMVGTHPAHFRILLQNESSLTGELAERHRRSRNAALSAVMSIIEDGKRQALFRPVDTRTAAFTLIGGMNWVVFWHRDGDLATISAEIADMAVRSLAVPDPNTVDGPEELIDLARETLDRLEATLRGQGGADR
ncbi:TetR/AcrR family transcriptional regulator [Mycobacterium vicinigordonae]|uniref:TetR/AcrR family transcriptional regulator n=1 Tax=Mycobacterium vicinigordonae TaxID=1719132 RepID=A0A7D6HMV3_9MYCO|nr:TetR/AcrR family transcriptional regulator [Mycobacterium vicinigordonae]QLL06151.1 TetR/AcrR family transcriptional regulator [Mycobacterium vicinigordonae]